MYMSMMMKNKFIIVLVIFSSLSGFAQFNVETYLSAPFQEAEITGLTKQLEYINNESFRSPLFRELELRIRTDDLNTSPDDVRLRLAFLNPMEQKANRIYEDKQTEYLQFKYKYEVNLLLANRYKQLIEHYYLCNYEFLLATEVNQLSFAYEQMQVNSRSLTDWIETDERILKKELERKDVNTDIEFLEYIISNIHNIKDSIRWDNFEMISINKMQEVLLLEPRQGASEIDLAAKLHELEQLDYKVDKAKSWSNIGYIQAEYDLDNDKSLNKNLGFQLGVSLPLFNPDKPKLQRKKLELLEEEHKLQETKNEAAIDYIELDKEFLMNVWKYKQVSERLTDLELLGKDISYDSMKEFIALVNYLANLKILKSKMYLDCLNTYIEILALSGRLSSAPYVDYISNDLRPFSFDQENH